MQIERPKSKQPIPENAKKVFDGVIFDVYQWEQELYNGEKTTFEKLKRPDTVLVIPVTEDGKIILNFVDFETFVNVVIDPDFGDTELKLRFLEAKLDPMRMGKLKEAILG